MLKIASFFLEFFIQCPTQFIQNGGFVKLTILLIFINWKSLCKNILSIIVFIELHGYTRDGSLTNLLTFTGNQIIISIKNIWLLT